MNRTFLENNSNFPLHYGLVDQLVNSLEHNQDRLAFDNELQYIDRQYININLDCMTHTRLRTIEQIK
jgi:hypothetical protein